MKKRIVLLVFISMFVVAGLGIFYVRNMNDENTGKYAGQKNDFVKKDARYFREYLRYFMPEVTENRFVRTIDEFDEEDIKAFLVAYYRENAFEDKVEKDGRLRSYEVSKDDVRKTVFEYFGISNYSIERDSVGSAGVDKVDEDVYRVYWTETNEKTVSYNITDVSYEGKKVTVCGEIVNTAGTEYEEKSVLQFTLFYNNVNYNVLSTDYVTK